MVVRDRCQRVGLEAQGEAEVGAVIMAVAGRLGATEVLVVEAGAITWELVLAHPPLSMHRMLTILAMWGCLSSQGSCGLLRYRRQTP